MMGEWGSQAGRANGVSLGSFPARCPMLHFMRIVLMSVLALFLASCTTNAPLRRDVTIQNDSSNHLDWVSVNWGGRILRAGVMPPGKGAMIFEAGLPAGVTTNVAVIEFINEDTPGLDWASGSREEVRARREKSWTRVPVDVSRLLRLGHGPYSITFRILSVTNADLLIERIESR
jgi:hypothetical protein